MSKVLDRLTIVFKEFDESWQGDDSSHRLDLAEVIWRGLNRNRWTQRRLARESGLADADISNLLHGNKNFTSSTLGRVVNALGVKVKLQEVHYIVGADQASVLWVHPAIGNEFQYKLEESTSGKTQNIEIEAAANAI